MSIVSRSWSSPSWKSDPCRYGCARYALLTQRLMVQENSYDNPKLQKSSECPECRARGRTCQPLGGRGFRRRSRTDEQDRPEGSVTLLHPGRDSARSRDGRRGGSPGRCPGARHRSPCHYSTSPCHYSTYGRSQGDPATGSQDRCQRAIPAGVSRAHPADEDRHQCSETRLSQPGGTSHERERGEAARNRAGYDDGCSSDPQARALFRRHRR